MTTRIGILEAGAPPGDLEERFGRYRRMFADLLGPGFETTAFDVTAGQLPSDPAAFAGLIVTGSAAGVYDDLPWIAPLVDFLRRARGRTRLVGICFGHQIMAEAFGGRVEKSAKGWGLGLHGYEIAEAAPWMDRPDAIAIPVSHQDQVVEAPLDARVLGGSAFTPCGVLAYDDGAAISMQCHPEFTPAFARALLEKRHVGRLTEAECVRIGATLDAQNDRERVAGWIRRFLGG